MDSGDVATWVGATATFAAVAVALYQPAGERKMQRMDSAKEQARGISAWIEADSPPKLEGYAKRKQVYVQNASSTPMFRVVLCLVPMDESRNSLASREQVSQNHEFTGFQRAFDAVPPGLHSVLLEEIPGGVAKRSGVEVAFIDAHGKSWVRRAEGVLESLGANDPHEGRKFDNMARWTEGQGLDRVR
ncbi:hypothetical protein [Rothia uropygialis]|uniref:hypothetical protein n=1 Tax=Kocuria sp. 36 TaxID=1415402 RepID=UPI00101CDB08|nr:hypothetical protein [Kocuria sp. 36]